MEQVPGCRGREDRDTASKGTVQQDRGLQVLDIPGRWVLQVRLQLGRVRARRSISRCRRTLRPGPMASPPRMRLVLRASPASLIRELRSRGRGGRGQGLSRLRRMTTVVLPHPNRART